MLGLGIILISCHLGISPFISVPLAAIVEVWILCKKSPTDTKKDNLLSIENFNRSKIDQAISNKNQRNEIRTISRNFKVGKFTEYEKKYLPGEF